MCHIVCADTHTNWSLTGLEIFFSKRNPFGRSIRTSTLSLRRLGPQVCSETATKAESATLSTELTYIASKCANPMRSIGRRRILFNRIQPVALSTPDSIYSRLCDWICRGCRSQISPPCWMAWWWQTGSWNKQEKYLNAVCDVLVLTGVGYRVRNM